MHAARISGKPEVVTGVGVSGAHFHLFHFMTTDRLAQFSSVAVIQENASNCPNGEDRLDARARARTAQRFATPVQIGFFFTKHELGLNACELLLHSRLPALSILRRYQCVKRDN
jgi:hypothetical protein